jgi:PiT family inorganic phosphate transporter
MEALLPVILILAGFYVGWNIGANDAANCIGTTVGAQIISYRKAVMIMALFVILGGVLQGHHVMKTVGKGIVITEAQAYEEYNGKPASEEFRRLFPDDRLPDKAILVALLSAGIFVTLATFSSVPVSTSQAIVGGVAGTGLGIVGMQASYFKVGVLLKIFGAWVISPVLTMILAFLLYLALGRVLKRVRSLIWSQIMAIAVVASAAYVSYSLGANDVGNAIGPLLSKYPDKGLWLALLGGVAMAVGAWTFGGRVTDTVGLRRGAVGAVVRGVWRAPVFNGRHSGLHLAGRRGRRDWGRADQRHARCQHKEDCDHISRLGNYTDLRGSVCGSGVPAGVLMNDEFY